MTMKHKSLTKLGNCFVTTPSKKGTESSTFVVSPRMKTTASRPLRYGIQYGLATEEHLPSAGLALLGFDAKVQKLIEIEKKRERFS